MDHWHAYSYTGRAYTDSAVRKGEAPPTYAPFVIQDWLSRPPQQVVESFTDPAVAAKWLRAQMEEHPPVDGEAFSVDARMGHAEQTLRQTAGAHVVWGYYSKTGRYVSRAVIRCAPGEGLAPCPRPVG